MSQEEWRRLAIQFDAQRMAAMWHLKALANNPNHVEAAKEFIAANPGQQTSDTELLNWLDANWGHIEQHWTATAIGLPPILHGYSVRNGEPIHQTLRHAIRAAKEKSNDN